MKPESLHALLIDRELGELPSESLELLEAWLAEHPECAAAVPSIHRTVQTTSATVRRFPELARPEPGLIAFPTTRVRWIPLAWAASILIGLAAWLGFRSGHESRQEVAAENASALLIPASPNTINHNGPWARYALAPSPRGGLTVVRRDIHRRPEP